MRKITLVLLIAVLTISSCKKTKITNCDEKEIKCDYICFVYWRIFEFKLIDKNNGEDLLFGMAPRYTSGEVKLFYDAARTRQAPTTFDNNNKKLVCMMGSEELYLEIKGAKVYKIKAEFRGESCCNGRVKTLKVDNASVCTCCDDVIKIGID